MILGYLPWLKPPKNHKNLHFCMQDSWKIHFWGNRLKAIQSIPQIGSITLEVLKSIKAYREINEIIQEMKKNLALKYFA